MTKTANKKTDKNFGDIKMVQNVLISGVGGQGILLAAELLGLAAQIEGYDAKKSEVHGMAQRGGSVNCHVRYETEVFSPTIPEGEADFLLAFEPLEALRFSNWLKKDGFCIFNTQKIIPVSTFVTGVPYPENIEGIIKKNGIRVYSLDATESAKKIGNLRVVNIVLLGVLSAFLSFKDSTWETALKNSIKPAFLDMNLKAFEAGKKLAEEA